MATPPRKTLGLPPPGKGDAATTITDRKPIRGGQAKSRHKPLAESPVVAKALPQQKPRGTPSRAPVVPKAGSLAHRRVPQRFLRSTKRHKPVYVFPN